jgi:NAD kinase
MVTSEKKNGDERVNIIDYVITIGGDGTILTLLRNLQEYEKTRILPPIITFS